MLRHSLGQACAWFVVLLAGCATVGLNAPAVTIVPLGQVINNKAGTYQPQGGECQALLEVSDMGGFFVLTIIRISDGWRGESVDDVAGIAWGAKDLAIFAVSPIYGKPGVFVSSCATGRTNRIVAPRTFNQASPDGADLFELHSLSRESGGKIRFFFAPDVELVDFHSFRTDSFLFEVGFDGSGFRKVMK